jgi:hypothetical protein
MKTPYNKTIEALRWWYSEHRCSACHKIPSDSLNILSVVIEPEYNIFTVQVITQCPKCEHLQIHILESEKALQRIVDQHKAEWLNV